MKIICKDAFSKEGKLVDARGKEIQFRTGAEIKIIAFEDDFVIEEAIVLSDQEKLASIEKGEYSSYKKIVDKGSFLYFKLRKKEDFYTVKLLEDLYLVYKLEITEERQISLYPCVCTIIGEEKMKTSTSLNDLYKNVYISKYGDSGANSANAFAEFYIRVVAKFNIGLV